MSVHFIIAMASYLIPSSNLSGLNMKAWANHEA